MRKIIKNTTILVLIILFFYVMVIIANGGLQPKIVIHKAMNYNHYNIIIISTTSWDRVSFHRKLYADIWSNNKKTNSYYLSHLDIVHDYDDRIKDITILPQENEIKVEFIYADHSKSGTGVDLYRIE